MKKDELKTLYKSLLPKIRVVARNCGYAIGEHGSMERDMDLIAVAWTEEAIEPEELVLKITKIVNGRLLTHADGSFMYKPKGRKAYTIVLDDYKSNTNWAVFIDLSIAPQL